MQVFFILVILWLFVTFVGHLSWLILAAVFQVLFGQNSDQSRAKNDSSVNATDYEKSRKVLRHLRLMGHLDDQQLNEVLDKLRSAQYYGSRKPVALDGGKQKAGSLDSSPVEARSVDEEAATSRQKEQITEGQMEGSAQIGVPADVGAKSADDPFADRFEGSERGGADYETIESDVDKAVSKTQNQETKSHADSTLANEEILDASSVVKEPALSRSVVIQSFLASHNIRWGEIVAGILIVVCSVGLVRTLWNPLVATHPLIPSVIFLIANVAIGSAGLYTLNRWRLRHTSRAVLIITILLIPLSVLAGIAAVGRDASLLATADPITVTFILLASAIYGRLAYCCISALVRPLYSRHLTFGFSVTVGLMPFTRVAVEQIGENAGWLLLIASSAVLATADFLHRYRGRKATGLSQTLSKLHLLFLGLSLYSCSTVGTYFVLCIRRMEDADFLPLAISLIPAMMGLASISLGVCKEGKNSNHSLVGLIVALTLVFPNFVLLVPAFVSTGWICLWALLLTACLVWSIYRARQAEWAALATLPSSIAILVVLQRWTDLSSVVGTNPWRSFLSGESFLVGVSMSALVFIWMLLDRDAFRSLWIKRSLFAWLSASFLIGVVLLVLPQSFIGAFPIWLFSLVLGCAAGGMTLASYLARRPAIYLPVLSICSIAMFWSSILKPPTWFELSSIEPLCWVIFLSGLTVLFIEEVSKIYISKSDVEITESYSNQQKLRLSAVDYGFTCVVFLGLLAPSHLPTYGGVNAALLMATALGFISAGVSHSRNRLIASQLVSVLCIGWFVFNTIPPEYYTLDRLLFGSGGWVFVIPTLFLAAFWLLVRETLAKIDTRRLPRAQKVLSVWNSADIRLCGWYRVVEVWLLMTGLLIAFASLLSHFISTLISFRVDAADHELFWVECLGVAGLLSFCFLARRYVSEARWRLSYASATTMLLLLWASCSSLGLIFKEEQGRGYLIAVSSSLVLFGSVVCYFLFQRFQHTKRKYFSLGIETASLALLAIVSIRLLVSDWISPVSDGRPPYLLATLAVMTWSVLGALWFRFGQTSFSLSSRRVVSLALTCIGSVLLLPFFFTPQFIHFLHAAGLATLLWALTFNTRNQRSQELQIDYVLSTALKIGVAIGAVTSIATTVAVFVDVPYFDAWSGGFLVSIATSITLVTKLGSEGISEGTSIRKKLVASWPISFSLLAGQVAWLLNVTMDLNDIQTRVCVFAIWMGTSLAAYWRDPKGENLLGTLHVIGVAAISPILSLFFNEPVLGTLSLISLSICGLLLRRPSLGFGAAKPSVIASMLSWWVLVGGTLLLCQLLQLALLVGSCAEIFTVWAAVWIFVWLVFKQGENPHIAEQRFAYPCLGVLPVIAILSTCELASSIVEGTDSFLVRGSDFEPLYYLKWLMICFLPFMIRWLPNTRAAWLVGYYQLMIVIGTLAVNCGYRWNLSSLDSFAIVLTAIAVCNGLLSNWSVSITTKLSAGRLPLKKVLPFAIDAVLNLTCVLVILCSVSVVCMIVGMENTPALYLLIGSISVSAWAVAQCASVRKREALYKLAVGMVLISLAMWASVDFSGEGISLLQIAMRWLAVSLLLLPTKLWILPSMLGPKLADSWRDALRWGSVLVGYTAITSLCLMLILEIYMRTDLGILSIPSVHVFVVGCMLAVSTILAALTAVFTGPKFSLFKNLALSEENRKYVMYGSQLLGGCVCLHLYLCRPDWILIELREFWFYIVMGVAFGTVGITEAARRLGDDLLVKELQRSAFLLPLIPILGFGMNFHNGLGEDFLIQQSIRIDVLLILAAVFYGLISHLWKHPLSRLFSLGLGNAAWWCLLTQTPQWAFMEHPQLWLIPPAFCVLFSINSYKDRIDHATIVVIRYSAMLTIYISSTADMLIQQIGVSLMGPIVLILLSLVGMFFGIILRVRSFLFLGAVFILLGTTSMVWHANRSLDSSWPWWVFGITTGILLLVGLTFLEKYKEPLRQYSKRLSEWEA